MQWKIILWSHGLRITWRTSICSVVSRDFSVTFWRRMPSVPNPRPSRPFCLWHLTLINVRSILQDRDMSSAEQRCAGKNIKRILGSFWSTVASVGACLCLTPRGFGMMITLLHGPSTYLTLSFRKLFQKRFMKTLEWSLGGGGLACRHFFIFWRDFLRFLRDGGCPPGRLCRGLRGNWGGGGALNDHLLWRPTLCVMETDVWRVKPEPTSLEVEWHPFLY